MNRNSRKGFIYFRYIFPIIAALIMMILVFIPAYRYITADTGLKEAMSLGGLIGNSWDTVRTYLFDGGADKQQPITDFSATVLTLIIVFVILFAVGLAVAIWTAVEALRYFLVGDTHEKSRVLFLTLVPNRILSCVYLALLLPIFTLPMLMPTLYDNILNYHVELSVTVDMLYIALALWLAAVIITAVSARFEIGELNVFFKATVEDNDDKTEQVDAQEPNDPYSELERRAKEEQAERILKLLNKDKE